MVVWSAAKPRSTSNSSTSRYERENRRYQRTAQTINSGSKCRHLNSAGRGLVMEYPAAYQTRAFSSCNTAAYTYQFATTKQVVNGQSTNVIDRDANGVPKPLLDTAG